MNTGKRPHLSRAEIVTAALEIADHDGLDALSMRKLAAAQNVTAMSIYNHVPNKDALLELMLARVVGEVPNPQLGPWREIMAQRAHGMRAALLRHPWAAAELMTRIVMEDEILRDIEACLACLIRAGFTYQQADWARNAIDSHIYGYTVQEVNYPVCPEEYRAAAAQYVPMIDQDSYPYSYGAARAIIDGSYNGLTDFSFGLNLILDGLERWLAE